MVPCLQGGESPHLVANAAFLAEKTAKETAESKLTTLRRSVVHKDELLRTLKAKVLSLPHKCFRNVTHAHVKSRCVWNFTSGILRCWHIPCSRLLPYGNDPLLDP